MRPLGKPTEPLGVSVLHLIRNVEKSSIFNVHFRELKSSLEGERQGPEENAQGMEGMLT